MSINNRLINTGSAIDANFNAIAYTGNGGTNAITGLGFKPDVVWIKATSQSNYHRFHNSIRGASKYLVTNEQSPESTAGNGLLSFDNNGFTLGSDTNYNQSGIQYVGFCWKAGGDAVAAGGTSVTNRLISANPDAGFSIMTYTGSSSNGTIEHGLNQTPEYWITKNLSQAQQWLNLTTVFDGTVDFSHLNSVQQFYSGFENVNATPTVINLPTGSTFYNTDAQDYLAMAYHSVEGYSKIVEYSGTADYYTHVDVGFQAAWALIKPTNYDTDWIILSNQWSSPNGLKASSNVTLGNVGDWAFLSDGRIRLGGGLNNNSNSRTYLLIAFANEF